MGTYWGTAGIITPVIVALDYTSTGIVIGKGSDQALSFP